MQSFDACEQCGEITDTVSLDTCSNCERDFCSYCAKKHLFQDSCCFCTPYIELRLIHHEDLWDYALELLDMDNEELECKFFKNEIARGTLRHPACSECATVMKVRHVLNGATCCSDYKDSCGVQTDDDE